MSYCCEKCVETPTNQILNAYMYAAEESSKNIVCGVGNRDHRNELFMNCAH